MNTPQHDLLPAALQKAALTYAQRGWPVLPVAPRGKHPLTEHGLHDATTDPDRIREWWTAHPLANIGLRTGVAFDVLDVDGAEGLAALSEIADRDTSEKSTICAGPSARTPSGGWHFYYTPTGVGNRVRFLPSLDWRGRDGYVVAPPSRGGDDHYSWEHFSAPHSDEQWDEWDIGPAPEWLQRLLTRTPPMERATRPLRVSSSYVLKALTDEAHNVERAPIGTRNHTLNCAAFALARFTPDGDLDPATIETVLLAAALDAGLPEREARRTIRSALIARGAA